MFCFSFSCVDFIFLHGNFLLTGFNFFIKILLAKRILLFRILLCYLLKCRRSVLAVFLDFVLLFRYSAALLMFHCSVVFRLIRQCFCVPPAFRCSVTVLVIRWCSAGVTCTVVPCSGVPGFKICPMV